MDIILASNSPRRKEIMDKLKCGYRIISSDFDERNVPFNGDPAAYVKYLSYKKAEAVAATHPGSLILGMDTVVYLDGKVLNKPLDAKDAFAMMRTMSGRTHEVYTGFTILQASASLHISDFEITEVKFQDLSEAEITGYVETGDYEGKAGGYAVQGEAGIFVEWIKGDFYNVVGMPLNRIYRELKGIKVL